MTVAQRVANGLGHEDAITKAATNVQARTDLKPSPALSLLAKAKMTLKGRMVGCLVADGTDPAFVAALRTSVQSNGATLKIVAPKVGGAKGSNG
jgi:catalase